VCPLGWNVNIDDLFCQAKRRLLIPQQATHFVWAYQGINLEELTQEQTKQLETDSGEIAFASMGGYIYLKAEEGEEVQSSSTVVVGANAIGIGSGLTCHKGTIDRAADDNR